MYYYGNATEKAWLSCAVGLGYSSADFLALESEKIKNLIAEAGDKHLDFIMFIGKTRTKTSVQPRSFLTPESIATLEEYLKMLEKQNNGKLPKLLWNGAKNDNLNDWLKALLKKANIETYGKNVKFHGLRKFLYDTLARMDEAVASVITAKKTDASKITYRTSLDAECERIFKESYKLFALNGDVAGKTKVEQAEKIKNLETALIDSQRKITNLETTNETLRERMVKLEQRLADHNLSIDKKLAALEEQQREQAFDILELQDKAKIKPKPIKDYTLKFRLAFCGSPSFPIFRFSFRSFLVFTLYKLEFPYIFSLKLNGISICCFDRNFALILSGCIPFSNYQENCWCDLKYKIHNIFSLNHEKWALNLFFAGFFGAFSYNIGYMHFF